MKKTLLCLALLALLFLGCKKGTENAAPAAGGKRYAMNVDAQSGTIRITPSGGWKMNLEYEHRFEGKLKPTGADLRIEKAQAKVSEEAVIFNVAAKPGESCEGSVFFAICTKQKCVPVEEKVAFSVAAK